MQVPWLQPLTPPVSMSYMRAPRLHQSTSFPWPLRLTISGALQEKRQENKIHTISIYFFIIETFYKTFQTW